MGRKGQYFALYGQEWHFGAKFGRFGPRVLSFGRGQNFWYLHIENQWDTPRQQLSNWTQGWAGMTFGSSGTGTGMDNSIPEVQEREGNWKNPFPQFGNGKGMKKNIPKIREWEGNEKIYSQNSGTGREWKKSIPTFREWESEALILGNGREREFPLTPAARTPNSKYQMQGCQRVFDVRIL